MHLSWHVTTVLLHFYCSHLRLSNNLTDSFNLNCYTREEYTLAFNMSSIIILCTVSNHISHPTTSPEFSIGPKWLCIILSNIQGLCVARSFIYPFKNMSIQHVKMSAMVSQITSLTSVYSTVYSRCRSKKTSKLCITGLCAGNWPVTGEFSTQMASNTDNVSIWWYHGNAPQPCVIDLLLCKILHKIQSWSRPFLADKNAGR